MGSGTEAIVILNDYHAVLKEVNENLLLAGIGRVKDD